MTPDTNAYMIAGFAAIFGGLILYVISLVARSKKLIQETALLDSLEDESDNDDTN